jgi:hypothetical protein
VTLDCDEFLTGIFGREEVVIDNLGFKTSKLRVISAEGERGMPFSYDLPHGYHIGAVDLTSKRFLLGIQFDFW